MIRLLIIFGIALLLIFGINAIADRFLGRSMLIFLLLGTIGTGLYLVVKEGLEDAARRLP